jgi:formylglycine-generating enzyme required for sulfatase activity
MSRSAWRPFFIVGWSCSMWGCHESGGAAPDHARAAEAPVGSMVLIPAGVFEMGSVDGDGTELPVHKVAVEGFAMDVTEVTTAQYEACVRGDACPPASDTADWPGIGQQQHVAASTLCNTGKPHRESHPINCVDASMAETYCRWAGKRLPTEEEWEYAARGTDGRAYPWGDQPPDATRVNACAQECLPLMRLLGQPRPPLYIGEDGWEATAPVGSFPAGMSPFGLLDMAGNVWEWTSSGYSKDYASPRSDSSRVYRGGSWHSNDASHLRTFERGRNEPRQHPFWVGFRCARSVDGLMRAGPSR